MTVEPTELRTKRLLLRPFRGGPSMTMLEAARWKQAPLGRALGAGDAGLEEALAALGDGIRIANDDLAKLLALVFLEDVAGALDHRVRLHQEHIGGGTP